jgi:hypothetical protein
MGDPGFEGGVAVEVVSPHGEIRSDWFLTEQRPMPLPLHPSIGDCVGSRYTPHVSWECRIQRGHI